MKKDKAQRASDRAQEQIRVQEQVDPYAQEEKLPSKWLIDEQYEIIKGVRYDMKPSPTFEHQLLVTQLSNSLYETCRPNGQVVVAPMDVHLDDQNMIQPDVIFITNDNLHIVQRGKIHGPPDLVAEVLSPSTSKKDKIMKKELYSRFQIKEYWIADPVHLTVDQFVLSNNRYDLYRTTAPGDTLTSPQFACVAVNMTQLFQDLRKETE